MLPVHVAVIQRWWDSYPICCVIGWLILCALRYWYHYDRDFLTARGKTAVSVDVAVFNDTGRYNICCLPATHPNHLEPNLRSPPPPTSSPLTNFVFWQDTVVDVLSVVPSVLFVAFDLRLWGFLRFLRLLRWADIATIVDSRRSRREETSGIGGDSSSGGGGVSSDEKSAGVQA